MTVFKDYWRTERRDVTRLARDDPHRSTTRRRPSSTYIESYDETTDEGVLVSDDACAEVWDVRDFFWPAQAPSIDKAEYLIYRTWETFASLKRKEADGYYENVEQLKNSRRDVAVDEEGLRARADACAASTARRTWSRSSNTGRPSERSRVGNRTRRPGRSEQSRSGTGACPFVVCSAMPDAFQIPGISVVEALAQLQEMLWTLQNQRLDVLRHAGQSDHRHPLRRR